MHSGTTHADRHHGILHPDWHRVGEAIHRVVSNPATWVVVGLILLGVATLVAMIFGETQPVSPMLEDPLWRLMYGI